jgi:hypothetical protein
MLFGLRNTRIQDLKSADKNNESRSPTLIFSKNSLHTRAHTHTHTHTHAHTHIHTHTQPFVDGRSVTIEAIPGHIKVIRDGAHCFNMLHVKCLELREVTFSSNTKEIGVFAWRTLATRWLVAVYYGFQRISRSEYAKLDIKDSLKIQVDSHGVSCGARGDIIVGVRGADRGDSRVHHRPPGECRYGSLINEARGNDVPNCRIVYFGADAYIFMTRYVEKGTQLLTDYGSAGLYMD